MVPESLADWTLHAIQALTDSGIAENDRFDFKANIQDTDNVRKSVTAFANTRGGFLVYGVSNDRKLIGIENSEFARDFGSKLRECVEPAVNYNMSAPIPVTEKANLHVVQIPRSPRLPHAVQLSGRWTFLKRTSAGTNDPMSYEEIRLAFQDTDSKRTKLALVASELDLIRFMADRISRDIPEGASGYTIYEWAWSSRFPTQLLDSVLGDAYSLIAKKKELWALLAKVRDGVRTINTYGEALATLKFSALNGTVGDQAKIQKQVRERAIILADHASGAKREIDEALSFEV